MRYIRYAFLAALAVHKHRAEGRRAKSAAVKLATEVQDLKRQHAKPEDEVLALLEPPR